MGYATRRDLISYLQKDAEKNTNNSNNISDDMEEMPEYHLNKKFSSVAESLTLFKDDDLVAKPGEFLLTR